MFFRLRMAISLRDGQQCNAMKTTDKATATTVIAMLSLQILKKKGKGGMLWLPMISMT